LAVYFLHVQHLPVARTAALLAEVYGICVSEGFLVGVLADAGVKASPFTKKVRDALVEADVAHFDETGLPVAGSLWWLHFASTDKLTLLGAYACRGTKAGRRGADAGRRRGRRDPSASTPPSLQLVLDHVHPTRRHVQDLTALGPHHRRIAQISSAAAASSRDMLADLVGVGHLGQVLARSTGLLARLTSRSLLLGPARRLRLGVTIRGRRPRGVT